MCGVGGRDAMFNCGTKSVKGGVVAGIQTFFAYKAPEPLDQVEVRRIGWEIEQLDTQCCGIVLHEYTALVAYIIYTLHGLKLDVS